jgi:hypothetical protein
MFKTIGGQHANFTDTPNPDGSPISSHAADQGDRSAPMSERVCWADEFGDPPWSYCR